MSISDIKKRLVVPSRCDIQLAKLSEYNAYAGPNQLQLNNFSASSANAGTQLSWNIPIQSPGILSKDMWIETSIIVSLTRTGVNAACLRDPLGILSAGGAAWQTDVDTDAKGQAAWESSLALNALVSWPLQRQSKNCSIILNSASVTTDLQSVLPVMESCFSEDEYLNSYCSSAPVMRDQAPNFHMLKGGNKSPLNRYLDEAIGSSARGSTCTYTVLPTNRSNSFVSVRCDFTEKLLAQPLSSNKLDSQMPGFVNINNLQIVMSLVSDLSKIWSCDGYIETADSTTTYSVDSATADNVNVPPSTITWAFNGTPNLLFMTYSIPSFIPVSGRYFYSYLHTLQNPSTPIALNGTSSAVFNALSTPLPGIPRYIGIYVRKAENLQNQFQPNTYAIISDLRITLGNSAGLLSNSNSQFLYYISKDGGSQLSYPEHNNYYGSVMMIDVAKSLPLNDNILVGEQGTFNFKVDANVRQSVFQRGDNSKVTTVPTGATNLWYMNYVFFFEGLIVVDSDNGGNVQCYQSILSDLDKVELMDDKFLHYTNSLVTSSGMVGSGFLSDVAARIKSFLKPVVAKVKDFSDRYGDYAEGALAIANVAGLPFAGTLHEITSDLRTGINAAHKYLGSGMPKHIVFKKLLGMGYSEDAIDRMFKKYEQDKKLGKFGNYSGAGTTVGGALGPSFGVGGGRRSMASLR